MVGRCATDSDLYWLRVASYSWLDILKNISGRGYIRIIKDLFFCEYNGKDNGRALYKKRNKREQDYKIIYKNIKKFGPSLHQSHPVGYISQFSTPRQFKLFTTTASPFFA